MKKSSKRSKKIGIRKTQMKHDAKKQKPIPVKPVLYTRRVKSNKQKKIKQVARPLWELGVTDKFDDDPIDDDQKPSASFREMMSLKTRIEKHKKLFRFDTNVGDVKGMTKTKVLKVPKQGKKETEVSFARRMDRDVQDVLLKTKLSKKNDAPMVDPETYKSVKSVKAVKRLNKKREIKQEWKKEQRNSGFEHLKDKVKFGEVVLAPPTLTTKPKKVGGTGGKAANSAFSLDKTLTT